MRAGGEGKGLGVTQSPGRHWADNTHVHRDEEWLIQGNDCVLTCLFFNIHLKGKAYSPFSFKVCRVELTHPQFE